MPAEVSSISLSQLLASIDEPVWREATLVAEFPGGPVSRSWQLDTASGPVVLRLDTALVKTLGLDRQAELVVLESVASVGIGPEVLWADTERGLLVRRLLPGRIWDEADLSDSDNLLRLGALLRRLHSIPVVHESPDLRTSVAMYVDAIGTEKARSIGLQAEKLLAEISIDSSGRVFCHRDVHCGNIIDHGELRLIDWEYAGSGDPCFELAVVAEQHQLDESQLGGILDGYAGAAYSIEISRLNQFRRLYAYIAELWSMVAH